MTQAPGRSDREGMTLVQLMRMFPTETSAREWFEARIWPDGRHCPRCGNAETVECGDGHPMPYRCYACNRYFSVRVGTVMERSKVSLQKWAIAIYLHLTSLKGVSSMKLHRDIGVTQKTAWFMLQRIREAWKREDLPEFAGPVEADETYIGGKRKNKSNAQRKAASGRGAVDMTAVVGAKDRATNKVKARAVQDTGKATLQGFVVAATLASATLYTDDAAAYEGMPRHHEVVNHSVSEYVRGMAHTNGVESFWSMLKRGYQGVYHKMSEKHLDRYVTEFAERHNVRDLDTVNQMDSLAGRMKGKRLTYDALIADTGLPSGARS